MTRNDSRDGNREHQKHHARKPETKDLASWKPGSESDEAKYVQAKGDFGVPMGTGPSLDRDYVTQNTKRSDPGAAPPRSGENGGDGLRTTGVGGPATGDGASSGGDLDPDFIGVGTGGSGLAASGPDSRIGAAATDGSSDEFASGGHAQGHLPANPPVPGGPVHGTVVQRDIDLTTGADGQTADNVNNPARNDDSFASEITLGEALGEDNPMPPAQP